MSTLYLANEKKKLKKQGIQFNPYLENIQPIYAWIYVCVKSAN